MLSELTQTQKDKHSMFFLIGGSKSLDLNIQPKVTAKARAVERDCGENHGEGMLERAVGTMKWERMKTGMGIWLREGQGKVIQRKRKAGEIKHTKDAWESYR